MKNLVKYSLQILLACNLVGGVLLYFEFKSLPDRINNNNGYSKIKDTITVTKTITASIQTKGRFIYFDGEINDTSFLISKHFSYDVNYPEEIFNGYLTEIKSFQKGKYYMWSKNKILTSNQPLHGWFVTDNISNFASLKNNTEYYQILYPIAEKKFITN